MTTSFSLPHQNACWLRPASLYNLCSSQTYGSETDCLPKGIRGLDLGHALQDPKNEHSDLTIRKYSDTQPRPPRPGEV